MRRCRKYLPYDSGVVGGCFQMLVIENSRPEDSLLYFNCRGPWFPTPKQLLPATPFR